jgi:hypothetical protein
MSFSVLPLTEMSRPFFLPGRRTEFRPVDWHARIRALEWRIPACVNIMVESIAAPVVRRAG